MYEHTMPMVAKSLERIAVALEKQKPTIKEQIMDTAKIYDADAILKYASEEELFSLFHKFKETFNEMNKDRLGNDAPKSFHPLDAQIGSVITELKQNYK